MNAFSSSSDPIYGPCRFSLEATATHALLAGLPFLLPVVLFVQPFLPTNQFIQIEVSVVYGVAYSDDTCTSI